MRFDSHPSLPHILEKRRLKGLAVSNEATEVPELSEDLEEVYAIFTFLSNRRSHAYQRPNPISLTEMIAALKEWKVFDEDERRDCIYFISRLDEDWVRWVMKQAEDAIQKVKNDSIRARKGRN